MGQTQIPGKKFQPIHPGFGGKRVKEIFIPWFPCFSLTDWFHGPLMGMRPMDWKQKQIKLLQVNTAFSAKN